jgi:cyclophilin family peptidyl-prolyl cis-trans isomerase
MTSGRIVATALRPSLEIPATFAAPRCPRTDLPSRQCGDSHRWIFPFLLLASASALCAQSPLPAASAPITSQTLAAAGAPATIDLRNHFSLPDVTGTVVQFNTVLGRFNFELFADTPITTANFLGYVDRGAYNNTIIHRSVPGFVIQGGGYTYSVNAAHIPVNAPIRNEFRRPNVRGSVAMAKLGGNPDSATSEWFVNLADNRANLDNQNGGFTVFARVIGNGMTVVDSIAAQQTANVTFSATVALENVPVRNITAGQTQLQLQNLIAVTSASTIPLYPTAGGGTSVLTFSANSANPAVVAASVSGSTLTLTPGSTGSASVTVTATETNGATATTLFAVNVGVAGSDRAPVIAAQPQPQIRLPSGSTNTVVFTVAATGSPAPAYQWRRNGTALAGQTAATLVVANASDAQAGSYTCLVSNSAGSVESQPAVLSFSTVAPADLGRLVNLAIRTNAGTGPRTLIVGFSLGPATVSGSTPLLVRGVGPSLAQFGLSGVLADPVATMFRGDTTVATNDNWGGAAVVTDRAAQVGAFSLASASSLDAALALAPASGSYTVQIADRNNATGLALAEIYDAIPRGAFTAATPRLVNVSARTEVGAGSDLLIAGFVVGGSTAKTVLIRAIGPGLATFGVTETLADPRLQLFAGSTLLAENDNWGGNPALATAGAAVGAFGLNNPSSGDAMLLVTLPPGSYTAQVSGANDGTGVALVEVYELP